FNQERALEPRAEVRQSIVLGANGGRWGRIQRRVFSIDLDVIEREIAPPRNSGSSSFGEGDFDQNGWLSHFCAKRRAIMRYGCTVRKNRCPLNAHVGAEWVNRIFFGSRTGADRREDPSPIWIGSKERRLDQTRRCDCTRQVARNAPIWCSVNFH